MLGPMSQFPFGSISMQEGFKLSPLSSCNVSQAKYLLALFNRGFSVQHENGELALCWKLRPLIAVSIWVPASIQEVFFSLTLLRLLHLPFF